MVQSGINPFENLLRGRWGEGQLWGNELLRSDRRPQFRFAVERQNRLGLCNTSKAGGPRQQEVDRSPLFSDLLEKTGGGVDIKGTPELSMSWRNPKPVPCQCVLGPLPRRCVRTCAFFVGFLLCVCVCCSCFVCLLSCLLARLRTSFEWTSGRQKVQGLSLATPLRK